MKSVWIWYYGELELYQSLFLLAKREAFGVEQPCFWQPAGVYHKMKFCKEADVEQDGTLTFYAKGKGCLYIDGKTYPTDTEIPITKGHHSLTASVICPDGLPAIYIDSDVVATDGSWLASPYFGLLWWEEERDKDKFFFPVGCTPAYTGKNADLSVFPFQKTKVEPVSRTPGKQGMLFDFGKELFGTLHFTSESDEVTVLYGESPEEAQAYGNGDKTRNAVIYQTVKGKGEHTLVSRAFRYVSFTKEVRDVFCDLELVATPPKASFTADDPTVRKVFDVCAYTFRLCTRECFLDGIKRDRWFWSGDSFQSYLVNDYLFGDPAAAKRTIISLFGKPPYEEHINTINAFSSFLIIGTADYIERWGDMPFLRFMWSRIKALYAFILSRLSPDGLVVRHPGDWIFLDWGDMDTEGAYAGEQILLWAAVGRMAKLKALMGEDAGKDTALAEELKQKINTSFYSPEKGAYIDSFVSGKQHVSRQTNILAILFDLAEGEQIGQIYRNVLCNPGVTPIITPIFSFYELLVLCKLGQVETAEEKVDSYWGEMLSLGATAFWETFDPKENEQERLAMYGNPFDKSLCHAWSTGPIYFLGRYVAGVHGTSFGNRTFEVAPAPGKYRFFHAVVPMRDGVVDVTYRDGKVIVYTALSGGTLTFGGEQFPSLPGKEAVL
ncbi:MAG: hypothetical protein MJ078_00800 [Clostridia bacterium]|nr:hypothetical protein [Clostridia bacterium]